MESILTTDVGGDGRAKACELKQRTLDAVVTIFFHAAFAQLSRISN